MFQISIRHLIQIYMILIDKRFCRFLQFQHEQFSLLLDKLEKTRESSPTLKN